MTDEVAWQGLGGDFRVDGAGSLNRMDSCGKKRGGEKSEGKGVVVSGNGDNGG